MLAVVYLISTEGHTASAGEDLVREDLCAEAIRLGRLLAGLMPDEPEALGLLALMLLTQSRRAARTTAGGDLVLLADQDRGRWDTALVAEVEGPDAALAIVEALDLDRLHVFHAVRADLLRRLGRDAVAALAYDAAIARTEYAAEQRFLRARRDALAMSRPSPPRAPR